MSHLIFIKCSSLCFNVFVNIYLGHIGIFARSNVANQRYVQVVGFLSKPIIGSIVQTTKATKISATSERLPCWDLANREWGISRRFSTWRPPATSSSFRHSSWSKIKNTNTQLQTTLAWNTYRDRERETKLNEWPRSIWETWCLRSWTLVVRSFWADSEARPVERQPFQ